MSENNGGKSYVTQSYGAVFGDNKAITLSIMNGKAKISIATCISNNGNQTWDWQNSSSVLIDFEDLNKFLSACKTMAHIYVATKRDPSLASINPLYNTVQIRMPLIAKSNGTIYGELSVGFVPDPKSATEKTFGIKYVYQGKNNAETKDWYIFRRSVGAESELQFKDTNGLELHTSHQEHLQFANFIRNIEAMVSIGKVSFGLQQGIKYSLGNGNRGGHSNGGNSGGYGGYGSSGGNSGSDSAGGNDSNDDIPF